MKKKIAKKPTQKRKISPSSSMMYIRYISFALMLLAVIWVGKILLNPVDKIHVLGAQTGSILLADHGGDSGSGGGDSGNNGGSLSGDPSLSGSNNTNGGFVPQDSITPNPENHLSEAAPSQEPHPSSIEADHEGLQ